MTDSLIRALERANPASPEDFADLPAFTPPLSRRHAVLTTLATCAAALLAGIALTPSTPPAGAKVLGRALGTSTSEVLHWRIRVETPQLSTYTDELWMHVGGAGAVDAVRELRLDGDYAGMESLTTQPHGLGNLADTVSRTRSSARARVKTTEGVGYGESFASVIATAQQAANGELDLGRASEVTYAGRPAYEVRIRDATRAQRTPAELSITIWIDRASHAPLAVRWGEGATLWRTETVLGFERLPDDPALLQLG